MFFQNLKAIGEELSEICVLFCKYIYTFIYIDLLNVLVQIVNEIGLQKKTPSSAEVRRTTAIQSLPHMSS
jgi:hypothetical protein